MTQFESIPRQLDRIDYAAGMNDMFAIKALTKELREHITKEPGMCNCRKETEQRLLEALPEQLPEGHKNLSVSLTGYALMMGEGVAASRQVMPIDISFQAPTRAGGMKDKKQKMSMMANFCMFCGVKYEGARG